MRLTWWNLPQRAWLVIMAEAAVILFLATALVSEYISNTYYQTYVNSLLPVFIPLLSVVFAATSSMIAVKLYLVTRKVHSIQEGDSSPSRRVQTRRPVRKPASPLATSAGRTTVPGLFPPAQGSNVAVAKTKPVSGNVVLPDKKDPAAPTSKASA